MKSKRGEILGMRRILFAFYENWLARNWTYTIGFAVIVPIGGRFSYLSWKYGTPFDRVMAVIGGVVIGFLAVMTLWRFWVVRPVNTTGSESEVPVPEPRVAMAEGYVEGIRGLQQFDRELARGAAALGSTVSRRPTIF